MKVVDIQNTSTITDTSINLGDAVTLNGSATGGTKYKYRYQHWLGGTKWEHISPSTDSNKYTETAVVNYRPTTADTHYFRITVIDTATGFESGYRQFQVNVKNKTYSTPVNNSTLNKTEFYKGEKLVAQGSATGGSENYQYKFELCDIDGNRLNSTAALQNFSAKSTYGFTIPDGTIGTYMVRVTVKDTVTGKTSVKNLTFEIKDKEYPTLKLDSSVSLTDMNTKNNVSGRDELKIEASASGGSGGYKYEYKYIKDGGQEKIFADEGDDGDCWFAHAGESGAKQENASLTVRFLNPGKYKVLVYVYDNRGVFVRRVHDITVHQAPKYAKSELDGLITSVQGWYDRLTPSQVQVFTALTSVNSTNNFIFSDWQNALQNAKKVLNSGSEYEVDDAYEELKKQRDLAEQQEIVSSEASSVLFSVSSSLSNLLNWLLQGIGNLLTNNFGTTADSSTVSDFGSFGIKDFVDTYSPIFNIFATSLLVLLFGVNILSSALQYELFTLRGAVKIFGRLLLAKIWIDLSCTICLAVIDIAAELLKSIITKASNVLQHIDFSFAFTYNSGIWLVGEIINFLVMILVLFIILLMFIPLLFFLIRVICKLFVMNFELAALTAMSPVFFACLCGEETKQYFKNFAATFLSVVIEVVFMGIVYAAFINWYAGFGDLSSSMDLSNLDIGQQIKNFAIFATVFIAACSLMIKPPQIFKNLVR